MMTHRHSKQAIVSIVSKFAVTYFAFAAVIIAACVLMLYAIFSRAEFAHIRQNAIAIATVAEQRVDVKTHELLRDPDQHGSPAYLAIQSELQDIVESNPDVSSIYTLRPGRAPGQWTFVIDSQETEDADRDAVLEEEEKGAPLGEIYEDACCPDLRAGLFGPSADREVTEDKWGAWVSAYVPLLNDSGEAVGVLGVDISADYYLRRIDELRNKLLFLASTSVVLSLLFGFWGMIIFRREQNGIDSALAEHAENLEQQVQERMKAFEGFTASIVHELRAPLTAMRWSVEMLLDEQDAPRKEVEESLNTMHTQTTNMLAQVNDFLEAATMDSGKLRISPEKGNLTKIIEQEAAAMRAEALQRNLTLHVVVDGVLPECLFDPMKIGEVVRNFLSNALKYTKAGSVEIHAYVPKRSHVRVEVTDTGIGISKSNIDRLFRPFMRIEDAEKQAIGTGLGLAICKGIIDAHGGKIGVTSRKGRGSTFWFELPLK